MKATDAITKAKEHLNMFRPLIEGLRVEAATKNESNDHWTVIFSFFDDDSGLASAILSQRNRVYKKIMMDGEGELVGIENGSK